MNADERSAVQLVRKAKVHIRKKKKQGVRCMGKEQAAQEGGYTCNIKSYTGQVRKSDITSKFDRMPYY
jgi:hypothetical protein